MAEKPISPQTLSLTELSGLHVREGEPGVLFPGRLLEETELVYVSSGALHCVVDGRRLTLKEGDVLLCRKGCFRSHFSDMDCAPRFLSIRFRSAEPQVTEDLHTHTAGRLRDVLEVLLEESVQRLEGREDMLFALTGQLLVLLRRHEPWTSVRQQSGQEGEFTILRRALIYISTHVRKQLSVPQAASMTGVSASYLAALFNKHLMIAPGEYIRRARLQESRRMIRDGGMTFTQIAAELEYSTVYQFSRQFKEKFGITPTEYAKSVEKKG